MEYNLIDLAILTNLPGENQFVGVEVGGQRIESARWLNYTTIQVVLRPIQDYYLTYTGPMEFEGIRGNKIKIYNFIDDKGRNFSTKSLRPEKVWEEYYKMAQRFLK